MEICLANALGVEGRRWALLELTNAFAPISSHWSAKESISLLFSRFQCTFPTRWASRQISSNAVTVYREKIPLHHPRYFEDSGVTNA